MLTPAPAEGDPRQLALGSALLVLLVVRVHFVYADRVIGSGSLFDGGTAPMALAAGITTFGVCALLVVFEREPAERISDRAIGSPAKVLGVGVVAIAATVIATFLGYRVIETVLLGAIELDVLALSIVLFAVAVFVTAIATGALLYIAAVAAVSSVLGYLIVARAIAGDAHWGHAVAIAAVAPAIVVVLPYAWIAIEGVLVALAMGSVLAGMDFELEPPWTQDPVEGEEPALPGR